LTSTIKVDTIQDSGGNTIISSDGSGTITQTASIGSFSSTGIDDNASSTAITINSSNLVGIGTSSPSYTLQADHQGSENVTIVAKGLAPGFGLYDTTTSAYNWALYNSNGDFTFYNTLNTNGFNSLSEKMRITSGGNVGIGTSSPTQTFEVSSTQSVPVKITHSDGGSCLISFNDSSTTDGTEVLIGAEGNNMVFHAGDLERMRIDSSGNVGIGTSSPVRTLHTYVSSGNAYNLFEGSLGRWVFGQVGSTHCQVGGLYGNHSGIEIDTSGNVGIGTSSPSQKLDVVGNIEVSGSIYLGGTGSANELDDYEEGTFTPTLNVGTATTQLGSYVKVGNVCHIFINIADFSDTTTASNITITLPFTSKSGDDYQSTGAVMYRYADILNGSGLSAYLNDNSPLLQIFQNNTTGNWSQLRYSELNNALNAFRIQLTYFTA